MNYIKDFLRLFTRSTPFLLGNTLSFLPYLLFLNYSDGLSWSSILPFVLFYTLRMTGIFLLRVLPEGVDSYTLWMIAILLGCGGSLIGTLGFLFPALYSVAAVALGLAAAWFLPAKLTVDRYEWLKGSRTMRPAYYFAGFLLAILLFLTLSIGSVAGRTFSFALYTIFFIACYHTVTHYPHFDLKFAGIRLRTLRKGELLLFAAFFLLLFLLRIGRSLTRIATVDLALIGFCGLFLLLVILGGVFRPHRKLPLWLNSLTFVNGMMGNFLFLFGSLYVGTVFGGSQVPTRVFLPYILGMMIGLLVRGPLLQRWGRQRAPLLFLSGQAVGLLLILWSAGMWSGFFILSLFRSICSAWLNEQHFAMTTLPFDQRLIAKGTVQNEGSLLHQFVLMLTLSGLILWRGLPQNTLLSITTYIAASQKEKWILEAAKYLNVGLLLAILLVLLAVFRRKPAVYQPTEAATQAKRHSQDELH